MENRLIEHGRRLDRILPALRHHLQSSSAFSFVFLSSRSAVDVELEEDPQLGNTRNKHIKKGALKSKALSITFNEKGSGIIQK